MTLPVPPDAGASYLGAYTLRNEWVVWLLKNDPHLLTVSPAALHRTDLGEPPLCKAPAEHVNVHTNEWVRDVALTTEEGVVIECERQMLYRPGFWCCYQHAETVRVPVRLKLPKMRLYDGEDQPVDALALIGKDVDIEYRDKKWRVTVRKLR